MRKTGLQALLRRPAEGIRPGGGLYRWPARRVLWAVGATATVSIAAALLLPLWVAPVAALVLPLTLLVPGLRRPMWVLCSLTAVLFLLVAAGHRYGRVRPLEALAGQTDTVTGWVAAVPASGSMYTLQVTQAERVPAGSRLLLYCPDECAPSLQDTVTARVRLDTLYDSQFYRRAQGIHLCAFPAEYGEDALCITRGSGVPAPSRCLWPLKQRLTGTLRGVLPGEEGALLAALCLGDRSGVTRETLDAFARSGISHILVVSGLHLSLIAGAVLALLRFCGRRSAALLTVPVVVLFMLFIGGTPSVVRAGVMCLVWLVGRVCRQRADALNSLGLAALCLLLYDPYTLFSAGFQLSFAATVGVVTLTPRLYRAADHPVQEETWPARVWRGLRAYLWGGAAVCIAATIPALPFVCYYYGGFPLTTVLTNLLAIPAGTGALLAGWLGVLLAGVPLLYPIGQGLLLVAGYLARYLAWAAELCSPQGTFVRVDTFWSLALVAGLCVLLVYGILRRVSRHRLLAGVLALSVLAVGVGLPLTLGVPRLTVSPAGDGASILLRQGGRAVLLVTHSDGLSDAIYTAEDLDLDLVFVGDGDPADGGTLARLVRETDAAHVYTTATTGWTAGVPFTVHRFYPGDRLSVWGRYALTVLADGWWRLEVGDAALLICTDPAAPPPEEAVPGMVVYAGGLPARPLPTGQSVLVCGEQWLAANRPAPVHRMAVLTDKSVTFTTRPTGEWSVLPWL